MNSLFKINARDHLCMIVMTELAKAYKDESRWISLEKIARWGKFSQGYLEEIVAPLRRAKLVKARKGAGGGYRLSRDPKSITAAEIITALHGKLALVPCLDSKTGCSVTNFCASQNLWSFLQNEISKVLISTTLKDLIKHSKPTPNTLHPTS